MFNPGAIPLRFFRQLLRGQWTVPRSHLAIASLGVAVALLLFASVAAEPAPWILLALALHICMSAVFVHASIRATERQAGAIQEGSRLLESHLGTVKAIAIAMEARDPYTQGHCLRVRHLARKILARMGTKPEARESVEVAALLHDVGKIGTADSILLKPGRLSKEEYARLMLHVKLGVEIIEPLEGLNDVAKIVKHHHERIDGKGYPDGLKGDEIPFGSRVIAVADTIDAMRSSRPYRSALSLEDTIDELRRARGQQLDPRIVDAAIFVLDRGTRAQQVQLETMVG